MTLAHALKGAKGVGEDLAGQIGAFVAQHPEAESLFAALVQALAVGDQENDNGAVGDKRRRVDSGGPPPNPVAVLRNVSLLPRRMLHLYLGREMVAAVSPKDGQAVELEFPTKQFRTAVSVQMPAPGARNQPAVVVLLGADAGDADHPLLAFRIDAGARSPLTIERSGRPLKPVTTDEWPTALSDVFTAVWPALRWVRADARLYAGERRQGYFECKRRARDAVVYLLPGGVLVGFAKPLLWLPVLQLERVSFSHVIRSEFSLTLHPAGGAAVELDMVRDREYEAIVAYFQQQQPSWRLDRDGVLGPVAPAPVAGDAGGVSEGEGEESDGSSYDDGASESSADGSRVGSGSGSGEEDIGSEDTDDADAEDADEADVEAANADEDDEDDEEDIEEDVDDEDDEDDEDDDDADIEEEEEEDEEEEDSGEEAAESEDLSDSE